jgi:hypothetical protein
MSEKQPKIASLKPVILQDNRRITLELSVKNLPATGGSNIMFMPDISDTPPRPSAPAPGTYPHVELSILNNQRQQVASLLIVEHKEAQTALTLHLPAPADPDERYTARAEMTYQDEVIDVVEVPFTLKQTTS